MTSARDVRAADLQEDLVKPFADESGFKKLRSHQTRRSRRRPTNIPRASEASNPTEPVCERNTKKWVKLRSSMSCPELRSHLRTEVRGVA